MKLEWTALHAGFVVNMQGRRWCRAVAWRGQCSGWCGCLLSSCMPPTPPTLSPTSPSPSKYIESTFIHRSPSLDWYAQIHVTHRHVHQPALILVPLDIVVQWLSKNCGADLGNITKASWHGTGVGNMHTHDCRFSSKYLSSAAMCWFEPLCDDTMWIKYSSLMDDLPTQALDSPPTGIQTSKRGTSSVPIAWIAVKHIHLPLCTTPISTFVWYETTLKNWLELK